MTPRQKTIVLQTGREGHRLQLPERSAKKKVQGLAFEPATKAYRWFETRRSA